MVAIAPEEPQMGKYGPVSVANLVTLDLVSPGMPVFVSLTQVDNRIIRLIIAIPTMDANGDNLSGLSKLTVVSAVMIGGVNPFAAKSMTEILALSGIQKTDVALVPADAGQQKTVEVAIMNLGGTQAFAAACSD